MLADHGDCNMVNIIDYIDPAVYVKSYGVFVLAMAPGFAGLLIMQLAGEDQTAAICWRCSARGGALWKEN